MRAVTAIDIQKALQTLVDNHAVDNAAAESWLNDCGNGNILQKPLSPLSCARMRSLGSLDEHRRWRRCYDDPR
jgi:hypothetical protein